MPKLAKEFTEVNSKGQKNALRIEVEYDKENNVVVGISDVSSYSYKNHCWTDIHGILANEFPNALGRIVDSVDWREIYRESQIKETEHV